MTASFGVGKLSGDELPTDFLRRVDQLLYEAKVQGRNRVVADRRERRRALVDAAFRRPAGRGGLSRSSGIARRCPTAETIDFQRALDEARRQAQAPDDDSAGAPRRTARPRASSILARAGFRRRSAFRPGAGVDGRAGGPAGGRRPLRGEPAARPEDTPAEIAAELGLAGPLTLDQLAARWRDFVWRNHPDRQPAHARKRANARVAIANTLYDRARRELAKRR